MRITFYIRFLLIICLTGFLFFTSAQNDQRFCRIKTIVGSAKIRRSGTINWLDARVNMTVKERDAVRTFIESELELVTSEGSIIKIGENSTLELDKLNQKKNIDETKIKIMNGNVTANVKKLVKNASYFEFETPTATAAIRGTIVGFEVNKEKTLIKVFEGTVLVTPQGSRNGSEVKENQMTTVIKGQKSVTIEKLTEKSSMAQPPDSIIKVASTDSSAIDTLNSTSVDSLTSQKTFSDSSLSLSGILPDSVPATVPAYPKDTAISTPKMATVPNVADTQKTFSRVLLSDIDKDTIAPIKRTVDSVKTLTETKSAGTQPVKITVSSPAEGTVVKPLTALTITGTVTPVQSKILINGKAAAVTATGAFKASLNAPQQNGPFEIAISGEYGTSSQTINRSITIKQTELRFEINNPADGQIVKKTTIPVSGTVTPGAEVTIMSMKIPVTSSGTFSGQIPIPNEEGAIHLDFEAALDGINRNITRKIIFEPEYRFTLLSPQNGQEITSTTIQIRGEVLPVHAKVTALGRPLTVSTTGVFSGTLTIPDEEGKIELDFEISSGVMAKNESRTVVYKKPRDISRPEIQVSLPLISNAGKIPVTVFDRTVGDEIIFWYEIDGDKDFEKGLPNSSFTLVLLPGLHKYTIYATDKAGNQSTIRSQNITWFGTTDWVIKPGKLSEILHLPPSGPGGDYEPVYTVDFTVENLPENDMRLIGAITVINKTTGESVIKKMFTENSFSIDIALKNHITNVIDIIVEDVRKSVKTKTITVYIK